MALTFTFMNKKKLFEPAVLEKLIDRMMFVSSVNVTNLSKVTNA